MTKNTTHISAEGRYERRRFLKLAGCGTLGIMTGGFWPKLNRFAAEVKTGSEFVPDIDISLSARPDEVAIFPGVPTKVWQYHAKVENGDKARINKLPGSYLGPIIKVHQGEKIRILFKNNVPEETIVHWHGLHVPAIMDGHPRYVVPKDQAFLYEFEVKNRAGTYWYHPHPHGRTGPQVYRGMAGLFLVSDDQEQGLGLPDGEYDVPLVIQDRTFDSTNQLVYMSGHRMERMTGFLGDMIMVNGLPDFTLPVATCAYRLRLLNGSNSRIYKLAWNDGRPLIIIGTDGGLLEKPVYRKYVFLAPGERLELWADFNDHPVGYETSLTSLPFETGGMDAGRMSKNPRLPNGSDFPIFSIKVTRAIKNHLTLPAILSDIEPIQQNEADNFSHPRQFYLTMQHMQWSINGRVFQLEEVDGDEIVQLGSKEIWEFNNTGGGMMRMMNMPHPIHLHGKQFRVIERRGVMHEGYVDEGWKDTVLLMPGESVRFIVAFDDYSGMFLYHCHNLEHEDLGMMRNYFVRDTIESGQRI